MQYYPPHLHTPLAIWRPPGGGLTQHSGIWNQWRIAFCVWLNSTCHRTWAACICSANSPVAFDHPSHTIIILSHFPPTTPPPPLAPSPSSTAVPRERSRLALFHDPSDTNFVFHSCPLQLHIDASPPMFATSMFTSCRL